MRSSFEEDFRVTKVFILDGAMATEFETMARGFNDEIWHTKVLAEYPKLSKQRFLSVAMFTTEQVVYAPLNQRFPRILENKKSKKIASKKHNRSKDAALCSELTITCTN